MDNIPTETPEALAKEAAPKSTKEIISDIIREEQESLPPIKCHTYRAAQARFMMDVSKKVAELKIKSLLNVAQSESDGNITLTLFYR